LSEIQDGILDSLDGLYDLRAVVGEKREVIDADRGRDGKGWEEKEESSGGETHDYGKRGIFVVEKVSWKVLRWCCSCSVVLFLFGGAVLVR